MGDLPHSNTAFPYAAWWEDLGGQIFSLPVPGSQAAGLWPKCAGLTLLPGILTWLEWPMVQSESGVTQQSMEQCLAGQAWCPSRTPLWVILAGPAWLLWFANLDPQPSLRGSLSIEAFFNDGLCRLHLKTQLCSQKEVESGFKLGFSRCYKPIIYSAIPPQKPLRTSVTARSCPV